MQAGQVGRSTEVHEYRSALSDIAPPRNESARLHSCFALSSIRRRLAVRKPSTVDPPAVYAWIPYPGTAGVPPALQFNSIPEQAGRLRSQENNNGL